MSFYLKSLLLVASIAVSHANCSPGGCTVQGNCQSGFVQVCHEGKENECLDADEWPDHCASDGDTCGACTSGGGSGGCFSAMSTVVVQGKGVVPMKDIQVGDMVMVDGSRYEPVYAMGHRQEDYLASFLKISTIEESVEVTPEHLLYLAKKDLPVRADSIKVGDSLRVHDGDRKVTKIEVVEHEGLFDPLTPSGKVMVNGIMASTYIALQAGDEHVKFGPFKFSHEAFVHFTLSPMRVVCMGIVDAPCRMTNEEGIPLYIRWGMDLIHMITEGSYAASAFLLAALPLLLVFVAFESLVGASIAPLVVFVAAMGAKLAHSLAFKKVKTV